MCDSCLNCYRKHLGQAIVLMIEGEMGYPEHRWLAVGHMAEAEAETILDFPELANSVREERVKYQESINKVLQKIKYMMNNKDELINFYNQDIDYIIVNSLIANKIEIFKIDLKS